MRTTALGLGVFLGLALVSTSCSGGSSGSPTNPSPANLPAPTPTPSPTPSPSPAPPTATTAIGGRVLETGGGSAIANTTVQIVTPSSESAPSTTSDSEGRYRLSGIQSTTFTVRYSHPEYEPVERSFTFMLGTERTDLDTRLTRRPPAATPATPATPWSQLPPLSQQARDFVVTYNINRVYGSGATVGAVKRWNTFPISIYASSDFRQQDLRDAVELWRSTTNGKITFQIVTSPPSAGIVLDMQWPPPDESPPPETSCGSEGPRRFADNVILHGIGHYAFGSKSSCGPRDAEHRIGLAHGIGHILGLGGHTAGGTDVMGDTQSTWHMSPLLSEIINWLYSVPAGTRPE